MIIDVLINSCARPDVLELSLKPSWRRQRLININLDMSY